MNTQLILIGIGILTVFILLMVLFKKYLPKSLKKIISIILILNLFINILQALFIFLNIELTGEAETIFEIIRAILNLMLLG